MQTNRETVRSGNSGRHRDAESRRLYWYVAIVAALFCLMIGAGLIFGGAALMGMSGRGETTPKAATPRPTGQFMRRLPDGKLCRFTVFDHDRGEAIEDRIARCEEVAPPPTTQKRTQKFNWGGQ